MIQLATGFEVLTSLPLDSRNLMTKSEMLTANDNVFPDYFLTQCSDDDGKLYLYKKNNAEPSAETGKFTPLEDSFSPNIQLEELPIAGSDEVGRVYQYIGVTDVEKKLIKACWYTCEGNAEDGYEWVNVLVEPEIQLTEIADSDDEDFIEGSQRTIKLTQGEKLIGKFGLDKELVVTSGEVKKVAVEKVDEDDDSTWVYTIDETITYTKADTENKESDFYKYPLKDSTYIVLGIQNQDYPIFIDAKAVVSDKLGTVTENVTANCVVGAMEIGDIIEEGSDITDVVKKLLIKYYPPTIALSSTPINKVVELGEAISVNLSAIVGKKSEPITKVSFYKGTDLLEDITTDVENGGTFTHSVAGDIDVTTTFKGVVTDGKKTTESKVTYTFVNPIYWGVVTDKATLDVTTLTKVIEEKGDKTYKYVGNNEYCVFAYDSAYGNVKSILDASSFENLSSFEKQVVTVGSTSYNVYVGKTALTSSGFEYRFIF